MAALSDMPVTPALNTAPFTLDMLKRAQDSPLSDYHTDEAHSPDQSHDKLCFAMPSAETQRILSRFNQVAAQLLRNEPGSQDRDRLERSLNKIETSLGLSAPQSQHRMRDSGYVVPDYDSDLSDDPDATIYAQDLVNPLDHDPNSSHEQLGTKVSSSAVLRSHSAQDSLLKDAQAILERVTLANANLNARFNDIRQLNDRLTDQAEAHARAEMRLQSENESLRTKLVHDHSELLFLKLQLKALEIDVQDSFDSDVSYETSKPGHRLVKRLDGFKSDWEDVDARLRSRRDSFAIRLTGSPLSPFAGREDGKKDDEQGDWALDVCKKRKGRVESIVIRRLRDTKSVESPHTADLEAIEHCDEDYDDQDDNNGTDDDIGDDDNDNDAIYSEEDDDSTSSVVVAQEVLDPFMVEPQRTEEQPLLCANCERQIGQPSDNDDDDHVDADSDSGDLVDFETPRPGAWRELLDGIAALSGARLQD